MLAAQQRGREVPGPADTGLHRADDANSSTQAGCKARWGGRWPRSGINSISVPACRFRECEPRKTRRSDTRFVARFPPDPGHRARDDFRLPLFQGAMREKHSHRKQRAACAPRSPSRPVRPANGLVDRRGSRHSASGPVGSDRLIETTRLRVPDEVKAALTRHAGRSEALGQWTPAERRLRVAPEWWPTSRCPRGRVLHAGASGRGPRYRAASTACCTARSGSRTCRTRAVELTTGRCFGTLSGEGPTPQTRRSNTSRRRRSLGSSSPRWARA